MCGLMVEMYDDGADPEETERQTLALRRELLDLDEVESVRAASAGEAPPGSRAVDVAAVGALIVAVQPTAAAIGKLFAVVRQWLANPLRGTMKVTVNGQSIELRATAEQQEQLVETFLAHVQATEASASSESPNAAEAQT